MWKYDFARIVYTYSWIFIILGIASVGVIQFLHNKKLKMLNIREEKEIKKISRKTTLFQIVIIIVMVVLTICSMYITKKNFWNASGIFTIDKITEQTSFGTTTTWIKKNFSTGETWAVATN